MRKIQLFVLSIVVVLFTACHGNLWDAIEDLDARVARLEELCKEMNTNISALQTIVSALQSNDYITAVIPVEKDGKVIGYTITFGKHDPITIYNGEDGKDGANGTNGIDGKDDYTPILGVAKDTDGVYYWTLDGEWLLDADGNKLRVTGRDGKDGVDGEDGKDGENGKDGVDGEDGKDGQDGTNGTNGADGKDGVTPQLKIENGYWYISYDNGATWTELGKAVGEDGKDGVDGENGKDGQDGKPGADGKDGQDGDSMFISVTYDDNNVYFTLTDGSVLIVPRGNSTSDFDQTVIDNLVNSLELDKDVIYLKNIGDKDTIIAITAPFPNSKVIWNSTDTTVIKVINGVVEAVGVGSSLIIAKASNLFKECKIYVGNTQMSNYLFSVGDDSKVRFSQGNLQYQASTGIWRFADEQYEIIGVDNENVSSIYTGWIDLFGWGTSGCNTKYPYMTSAFGDDYANGEYGNSISGTNYDWGIYNAILNGGNQVGLWRTLNSSEWSYLLEKRSNASSLCGLANVNDMKGFVILPDDCILPDNLLFESKKINIYSLEEWLIMESYGAVFLPTAGFRTRNKTTNVLYVSDVAIKGYYWSTSSYSDNYWPTAAYYLNFYDDRYSISYTDRSIGCSVRLVQDVE